MLKTGVIKINHMGPKGIESYASREQDFRSYF
jgi:hypothetical protein